MSIWTILGIDETKDLDKLKNAYRAKLSENNPEDNPEGFKVLRASYEEAVRLANEKHSEEEVQDEDGSDTFNEREYNIEAPQDSEDFRMAVEDIYKNFYRRIDSKEWQRLLDTEFAVSLDTSTEAMDVILRFFMENIYIPQYIFKIFVETFSIDDRRQELSEVYPQDYIDYFINNSIYPDMIDYRLFTGPEDADYDGYINRFADLLAAIKKGDVAEQESILQELRESSIKNPYLDINICKMQCYKGELDEALETAKSLVEKLPGNTDALTCMGDVYLDRSEYEEAKKCYEDALSINPSSIVPKVRLVEIKCYTGQPVKAKEDCLELTKERPYDAYILGLLEKCNELIIKENKEKKDEDMSDEERHRFVLDTAWAYYQSYDAANSVKILSTIDPFDNEIIEYNNLKGRSYLVLHEPVKARECFIKWMNELDRLDSEDPFSEEGIKQLKRRPYVNYLLGSTYLQENERKKAEEYIDLALENEFEERIVAEESKCELLYDQERYSECLTMCETVLKNEKNFVAQLYLARTYFKLGNYLKALDEAYKVEKIYPYNVSPYKLEMDIYIKVKQYRDAEEIVKKYSGLNPESNLCKMMKAKILVEEKGDYVNALDIIKNIDMQVEHNDIEDKAEFYLLKGDCYQNVNGLPEAEKSYNEILKFDPDNKKVHRCLGMVYRKMLKFHEAVAAYSRQIELAGRDTDYLFRALTYKVLGEYKKADKDYDVVLQYTKPQAYVYTLSAENKLKMGEYQEAVDLFIKGYDNSTNALDKDRARFGLVEAYRYQERYEEALEEIKLLCSEAGDKARANFEYASMLSFLGRFEEAETVVGKMLYSSYKVDRRVYEELCNMKCAKGELSAAEKLVKKAGDEGIDTHTMELYIARLLLDRKEYAKAEKYFLRANEGSYKAYSELSEAAAGQFGGKTRYKRYKDMFLKLSDGKRTPETLVETARICRLEKDFDKAERLLKEAISMNIGSFGSTILYGESYKELCKVYIASKQRSKLAEVLEQARRYMGYSEWLENLAKEMK